MIERLEIFQMGTAWRNLIVVRLTAADGAWGLGEATAQYGDEAVVAYLPVLFERYVRGLDPRRIEAIWQRVYRNEYWRAGAVFSTAQGALDMACHDLLARSLGEPVHTLLGGVVADSVPAYGNGWYQVDRTPAAFAEAARAALAKGLTRLKFDPFGDGDFTLETRELDEAVALVAAVRDAIGPGRELYVEGHGRFGVAAAIQVARALEPFRPGWFEEPVPPENVDALREVTLASQVPVAAGERWFSRHAFRRPLEIGAVRIAQPDIGHAGGITEVRKIAVMADTAYVPVAFHNAASPLMTAAGVHLGSTLRNFMVLESFDEFMEPHVREAFPGRPMLLDGAYPVSSAPGFGVEIDEKVFAEHPPRSAAMDFWVGGWERRQSHYGEAARPDSRG
ncbi:MAG: mandelate racemase/muconate lactonizing enzyme family protein [Candidatus Limnocylindrales bacterium]